MKKRKKHFLIFVPGLGDNYTFFKWATRNWEKEYGLTLIFYPVGWKENKTFDEPLINLLEIVDQLAKKGRVSLIGSSAGGSAVLNAFAKRKTKIHRVINLCGRLRKGEGVFPSLDFAAFGYPAFKESVLLSEQNQKRLTVKDKKKILAIRAFYDEIVPSSTSILTGATNIQIPTVQHLTSMIFAILFFKKPIITFLKS